MRRIRVRYPEYAWSTAFAAANQAIDHLERKNVLYRDGGTLRLVTTEQPNESTAP